MPAATNPSRSTPVAAAAAGPAGSGSTPDSGTTSSSSSSSGFEQFNNGGSADRITIGSTVKCVYEPPAGNGAGPAAATPAASLQNLEGEVMAFEPRKILVIKSTASNKRNSNNNIHMINLSLPLYKIQVLSEKKEPLPPLPSLNVNKLNHRLKDQIDKKKRQVLAYKQGVSREGQELFLTIQKTIDEVDWNGETILVLKEVNILPPYRPEDVKGISDSQALKHVRKVVEKHIQDQQQLVEHQPSPSPHRTADPPGAVPGHGSNEGAPFATSASPSAGGGSKSQGPSPPQHQTSQNAARPAHRGPSSGSNSNRNSHHTNNNNYQTSKKMSKNARKVVVRQTEIFGN